MAQNRVFLSSLGQHTAVSPFFESEMETFFRVLLHDNRNSFYFVSSDESGTWKDRALKQEQLYEFMQSFKLSANYYITHNGFTEKRRLIERTRQLNALFFDLDCHAVTQEQCDSLTDAATKRLNEAVQAGDMPMPSLVVHSGRGIHLYYVLERSVPYRFRGKGSINEKGINLYKHIQNNLASVIEEQLEGLSGIEVDRAVFDHTRVARIPGTYNTKAKRFCSLKTVNEVYHHLADLASYRPHKKSQVPVKKRPATILSFHPLMMSRLNKVAELQAYRKYDCEGNRELMCFVYYNTAVQVYSQEDAVDRLNAFNQLFTKPLPQSEITGIRRAVDSVVNVKGERGHYILSASKLVDLLSLTEQEMKETHFFASKRMIERMQAKRKTKEKREHRNNQVINLYSSGQMTQSEVAKATGCSLRTVQSILKEAGLTRRRVASGAPLKDSLPTLVSLWEGFSASSKRYSSSILQCAKNWLTSSCSVPEGAVDMGMRSFYWSMFNTYLKKLGPFAHQRVLNGCFGLPLCRSNAHPSRHYRSFLISSDQDSSLLDIPGS